jgi:small subunit ribosomal protein S14
MSKKSMIQRELKREKSVKRHDAKRTELKAIIKDPTVDDEVRWVAAMKLQKLPRNSAPVRLRNRCNLTGRPRANLRKFGISRNMLRLYAMFGQVPGLRKSSW